MDRKFSRRDFLKSAGTLLILAGGYKAIGALNYIFNRGDTGNRDYPQEAPSMLKVNEICVPALSTYADKEHISESILPFSEKVCFYSENQIPIMTGDKLQHEPIVNHARAENIPVGGFKPKEIFGVELPLTGEIRSVEIAENVTPITRDGQPRKIVTTISDEQALVAVYYDTSNAPKDYDQAEKPEDKQIMEVYSLKDIATLLVANSRWALDVKYEDVCNSIKVNETMVIGTDCVVAQIDINGRKGFFAFDVKERKAVDVVDLKDIYRMGNKNIYPSSITNWGDFVKENGVVLAESGKDVIVDIKNGLVAGEKRNKGSNSNTRDFYYFGFVPSHEYKINYPEAIKPDEGPFPQRSSLRILPFMYLETDDGNAIERAYPNDWDHKNVVIKPLTETTYFQEETNSSNPPKLITREPYMLEVNRGKPLGTKREMENIEIKLTKLDVVEEYGDDDNWPGKIVAKKNIKHWPVAVGDQHAGLIPRPMIENGDMSVQIGKSVSLKVGKIDTGDRFGFVSAPYFGDNRFDILMGNELIGKLDY